MKGALKVHTVAELNKRPVPERFKGSTMATITEEQIEALLDDCQQLDKAWNLLLPAVPETVEMLMRNFKCNCTGACCRGEFETKRGRGIALSPPELQRLAKLKGMPPKEFRKKLVHRYYIEGQKVAQMRYPCPFWSPVERCTVYSQRPSVCRIFPLDAPTIINGLHPASDGVALLTVNLDCPGGKELARNAMRIYALLARVTIPQEVKAQGAALWEKARATQGALAILSGTSSLSQESPDKSP